MTLKTSIVLEPSLPILSKASAAQQVRADIGRNFGYNTTVSALSGEVAPQLDHPMSILRDQANFMQALQQQATAVAYLLPPSLDVPLISLTKAPNGLSARLLVLYEDNFEDGKVVIVAGPDKEATVWLHRRLYRSMNKEKIVTRKRQVLEGSLLWIAIGCVVFGAAVFFAALVWAEEVDMGIMNLIETNQYANPFCVVEPNADA